ncbi:MAG: hypothetical protein JXR64_03825 [Spirochaetales bacterium]|nr:hypothetical protein [Spirochaetales bacterium]
MISKMGKKIFFIHPPSSLQGEYLESVFRKEFEIYLLDSINKIEKLLTIFKDAILFINIDDSKTSLDWIDYIDGLQKKNPELIIGVFSKSNSSSLKKALLLEVGIQGGFIELVEDNWRTVELIIKVLEANEARGRRKNVRLDLKDSHEHKELIVKIFTLSGFAYSGEVLSMSSAGLLTKLSKGNIRDDDNIDTVIFQLNEKELRVKGYMLKKFEDGSFFISFEDIEELDKQFVQSYIFDHLQKSFISLLNRV